MNLKVVSIINFFFQAEDGIRDGHVTGVQTCALPISKNVANDAEVLELTKRINQLEVRLKGIEQSAASPQPSPVTKRTELPKTKKRTYDKIGRASCRERVEISAVEDEGRKRTGGGRRG